MEPTELSQDSLLSSPYVTPDRMMQVYSVQSFGLQRSDLDIDFQNTSRPHLVTQVLLGCLRESSLKTLVVDQIWAWSLKQRLHALIVVVIATSGEEFQVHVRCQDLGCNELFELPLDLAALKNMADTDESEGISCLIDSNLIRMRLPTGNDQLKWLQQEGGAQLTQIAAHLIVSINGEKPQLNLQVPYYWLDELSAILDRHDQLMTLNLETTCPACGTELKLAVDLEKELLNSLAATQRKLYIQVHKLASHYHWTEADIMCLSRQRRLFYLSQLGEGGWA